MKLSKCCQNPQMFHQSAKITVIKQKFVAFSLGLLCWTLILSFCTIPLLFLLIAKGLVILLAKIFRPELHPVSTSDAPFTLGPSWEKSKLSFGFILQVEGELTLSEVRERFEKLLEYDKLRSYLVSYCGHIFRKTMNKEEIEMEKLVKIHRCNNPEDFEELMSSWMASPYVETCPAWEALLTPSYNNNNDEMTGVSSSTIAFKVHHAFADGYSLLHILEVLTGSKAPYLVKGEDRRPLWKQIWNIVCLPLHLRETLGWFQRSDNPFTLPHPQTRWIYSFTSCDLKILKNIRRKHEVHFASVMISLIVGTMRRFLLNSSNPEGLPPELLVADTLPCELHPAVMGGGIICNHWTIGIISSPLQIPDPLQRLIQTEHSFRKFHDRGLEKFATHLMFPFAWLMPHPLSVIIMGKDRIGVNCGLTSLIGADEYMFQGKRVKSISPLLTLVDSHPFTAFSWFTFSHGGRIHLTLAAAPDMLGKDKGTAGSQIMSYFHEELYALELQCGN